MYPMFHLTSAFVLYDREGIMEMHALAFNVYKSDSTCETQRPSCSPRASTWRGLLTKSDSTNYFYRVFDVYGVSCTGGDYDIKSASNASNTLSRGKRLRNFRREKNRRSDLGHSHKAIRRASVRKKLAITCLYKFRSFFYDSSNYQRGEKLPYLVESVSSNGLDVKVTLITVLSKAETQSEFNNSEQRELQQGTGELVEKHYNGILGTLNSNNNRHTIGVFKHSVKHEFGSIRVIGIGIDPGKNEVFGTVRTEIGGSDVSRVFSEALVQKSNSCSLRRNTSDYH